MTTKKTLVTTGILAFPLTAMAFFDAVPPLEGVSITQFVQQYDAHNIKDSQGNNINLPASDTSVLTPMTQLIYYPRKHKAFDMDIGYTAFFPYQLEAKTDLGNGKADTGLGDVKLSVYLQTGGLMSADHPSSFHRFEVYTWVPVGEYDANNTLNPGANYYKTAFQYTGTWWLTPKWSVSNISSYTWNMKNDDPLTLSGAKKSTQAGDVANVVVDSAYQVTDRLYLGVTGYYTKQITEDKVDGRSVPNSKQEVWAFGPGFVYAFTPINYLVTNWWFEHDAKNRSEGQLLMLRFTHQF